MTEITKHKNAIIAAVSSLDKLDTAIGSCCKTIFLLTGDIFNLKDSIDKVHQAGKKVYIDVDLMGGFSKDAVFLKYVQEVLRPDGVITTRSGLVRKAKAMKIFVVQRFFIFDSMSLKSGVNSALDVKPDICEILPGISAKIISEFCSRSGKSVIGSGFIASKEDAVNALEAGAIGVTTSNVELWENDEFVNSI